MSKRNVHAFVVFTLLTTAASAQTFIVDANNGPGTHFTDLAKAVASVPDGSVLRVRRGSYVGFTLSNRSLTILGDGRDAVTIAGPMAIGPLRARDKVSIRDLTVLAPVNPPYLKVRDSAGLFSLGNVFGNAFGSGLRSPPSTYVFTNCRNVQIDDCELWGPVELRSSSVHASHSKLFGVLGMPLLNGGVLPGEAAVRQIGGRVTMTACDARGGLGSSAWCGYPRNYRPSNGGPAMTVAGDARLTVLGGTLTGGQGGHGRSNCFAGANGGNGLEVTGSVVAAYGAKLAGGAGGNFGGTAGLPFVKDAASSVTSHPSSQPAILSLEGVPRAGGDITFAVSAQPASRALLLLGLDLGWFPLEPLGLGTLHAIPVVVLGDFPVPSTGILRLRMKIPNNVPRNVPVYGQFLTLQLRPVVLWATNAVTLIVKS